MFLVCNQCGNHNPEGASVCDLCKDPLSDEKLDRRRRRFAVYVPFAVFATITLFVLPAAPVQLVLAMNQGTVVSGAAFWLFYVGLWAIGFVLARVYQPKPNEQLDLGDRRGMTSLNPFRAARQEVDRAHVVIGFALLPVHFVVALWTPIIEEVRRARAKK